MYFNASTYSHKGGGISLSVFSLLNILKLFHILKFVNMWWFVLYCDFHASCDYGWSSVVELCRLFENWFEYKNAGLFLFNIILWCTSGEKFKSKNTYLRNLALFFLFRCQKSVKFVFLFILFYGWNIICYLSPHKNECCTFSF